MSSLRTPGYWVVDRTYPHRLIIRPPGDHKGRAVAEVLEWPGSPGRAEANAEIIASAPVLIDVCRALHTHLVDAIMHGKPVTQEVADLRNRTVALLARLKENA